MMWLLAERSLDPEWRRLAEQYSRLLEPKQFDRNVHDLGFIFLNTYLPWYRLTGDAHVRRSTDHGRTHLALRFNERGRYLRSFVAPESLFIDIMMNVPLIFYAARASDDLALSTLALAHCDTTSQTLVRADSSTAHEGLFDPDTGAFLRQATHQGLARRFDLVSRPRVVAYGFSTVFQLHRRESDLTSRHAERRLLYRPVSRDLVPPGTLTSRRVPTGSMTARPPQSPPLGSGTSLLW